MNIGLVDKLVVAYYYITKLEEEVRIRAKLEAVEA